MKEYKKYFSALILYVLIVLLYAWLFTAGTMKKREKDFTYYEALSRAFLNGQAYMLWSPSPELLSLPNPYDPTANVSLRNADFSLYNGKYYLYFGPVPALILSCIHIFIQQPIPDSFIVIGFLSGALLFNILIILWMKDRLFLNLSWQAIIPAILLAGLCHPIPWLLGRPQIYEAAIVGGQFFLIGGIYWGLSALEKSPPNIWKLYLAGMFLAFSIGSRITLLMAASFFIASIIWVIYQQSRSVEWSHVHSIAMVVFIQPFLSGLFQLAIYNFVRFHSFLETGARYSLTSGINQDWVAQNGKMASTKYVIPNLIAYTTNPLKLTKAFPFIIALKAASTPANQIPGYNPEALTGIIWALPFIFFSLAPMGVIIARLFSAKSFLMLRELLKIDAGLPEVYAPLLLGGIVFFEFLPLLAFYGVTMRYDADFIPPLALLSIWGFWSMKEKYFSNTVNKRLIETIGIILVFVSVLIGFLLGVTSYGNHFKNLNPGLFNQFQNLLRFTSTK